MKHEKVQPFNLSKNQYNLLIKISQSLTSTLNLDDILHSLLKETVSVLEADAGLLFIYDKDEDCLISKNVIGLGEEMTNIRVQKGEGMTGKTFLQKKPLLFSKTQDVEKGMSNIIPSKIEIFKSSIKQWNSEGPVSAISAPLIVKDNCIGVLTLDNFTSEKEFTFTDLKLTEAIANYAAIAIENARLYENEKRMTEE